MTFRIYNFILFYSIAQEKLVAYFDSSQKQAYESSLSANRRIPFGREKGATILGHGRCVKGSLSSSPTTWRQENGPRTLEATKKAHPVH